MQLTTRDAARLLGVPEPTVDRWLRTGELQAVRVNDQYRLNRIDLLEFASARGLEVFFGTGSLPPAGSSSPRR